MLALLTTALDWHLSVLLFYFSGPFHPATRATPFGLIPAIGMLVLLIGIALGIRARASGLWWFVLPPLALHLFLILAGDLHLITGPAGPWLLAGLAIAEIAAFILAWRQGRSTPLVALALSLFCLTYVLLALFWVIIHHFNGPPAVSFY